VVELAANSTTGYQWEVKSVKKSVLKPLGSKYIAPKTGLVGAGGTYKLTLVALAGGMTNLKLTYVRSFQLNKPGGSFHPGASSLSRGTALLE
jgi:predicted secreted protein